MTIAASDIRQVCLQLSADQALDYFFQSSRPVSFEILYNQDGITVYSYSRQNTSSDSGTFYPEKPEFYCMVWKNLNSVPASLKYNYYVQK